MQCVTHRRLLRSCVVTWHGLVDVRVSRRLRVFLHGSVQACRDTPCKYTHASLIAMTPGVLLLYVGTQTCGESGK